MKNKKMTQFMLKILTKYKGKLLTFFWCESFYEHVIPIFMLPAILAIIGNKYQDKTLTVSSVLILVFIYSLLFCAPALLRILFCEKMRYASLIKVESDLRQKLFNHTIEHSTNFFNNTMAGVIASKINNISKNFGELFETASCLISGAIMFIAAIFIYLKINIYLSLFLVVWTIALMFLQSFFSKKINKSIKASVEEWNKSSGLITDNFTNISNVKSFAKERQELKEVKKQGFRILTKMSKVCLDQSFIQIVLFFMMTSLMLVSIGFSFYLVLQNQMKVGTFLFVCQNMVILKGVIADLYESSINFMMYWTEMKDGFDTLLQDYEIKDKEGAEGLKVKKGKIVFKSVKFGYNLEKKV
ncbi:MAG TPA: ABC transporter ATP-binding protein [Rickettsiales bacterium]|nr:ABC transporter ATP-binding protein [Rickettsiales bacterium]